jgi:hypothetical protein
MHICVGDKGKFISLCVQSILCCVINLGFLLICVVQSLSVMFSHYLGCSVIIYITLGIV